jgi:hypothetical protein
MILKIWNEITRSWVFMDKISSVSCNYDCQSYVRKEENRVEEEKEGIPDKGIYKIVYNGEDKFNKYGNDSSKSKQGKDVPIFEASCTVTIENLITIDYEFIDWEKYTLLKDNYVIPQIVLITHSDGSRIKCGIPINSPVYVLNDEGTTVDKL